MKRHHTSQHRVGHSVSWTRPYHTWWSYWMQTVKASKCYQWIIVAGGANFIINCVSYCLFPLYCDSPLFENKPVIKTTGWFLVLSQNPDQLVGGRGKRVRIRTRSGDRSTAVGAQTTTQKWLRMTSEFRVALDPPLAWLSQAESGAPGNFRDS